MLIRKTIAARRWPQAAAAAVLTTLVAACGGAGGGASASPPAPGTAAGATTDPAGSASGTPSSGTPATGSASTATAAAASSPVLGDCPMFPANAIFNTRIDDASRFPAHANSAAWVALAGSSVPFTANWGTSSNPADTSNYWGMPVNIVDGTSATTAWPVVALDYSYNGDAGNPALNDCATASGSGFAITTGCGSVPAGARRFPFPSGTVLAEGGNCSGPGSCGDHHVLIVESGACRLWESYAAFDLGGQWVAVATAAWDLKSNALRPDGRPSAVASGLPITPLLARADEASSGEIRHALRVTFRAAALSQQHLWPARFATGSSVNPGAIPFGALLRLKAGFTIPSDWTPQAKAVALAAQRYGMYVSDIGPDFYVQGVPDSAWDPQVYQQLRSITMDQMEFVDLGAVTADARFLADSMAASW